MLRYLDTPLGKRAITWLLALGGLAGVSQKSSVQNAEAVDHAAASTSIAVYAAESVDSLRVDVERMRRRIVVLERAAGGDKLAEARESIARPAVRKPPAWQFWRR